MHYASIKPLNYWWFSLYEHTMPPQVSFAPHHRCANYPICKATRYRPRTGGRDRELHCKACHFSSRSCTHPDCDGKAALPFKKDASPSFCSMHYRDPCHTTSRAWHLCSNATIGCRQLSDAPGKGKYHACTIVLLCVRTSLCWCVCLYVCASVRWPPCL